MAVAKKKTKTKVKVSMRWNGKLGKYVKKDPKRVKIAMLNGAKQRGKKKKFKNNAKRIANIKKAFRTGKNIHGKKIRKIGRPKGSKDTKPRKERSDKGKPRGPRKKKRAKTAAKKKMR